MKRRRLYIFPFEEKLLPEYVTSIFVGAASVVLAGIRWRPYLLSKTMLSLGPSQRI
jgi:hypothetical protein